MPPKTALKITDEMLSEIRRHQPVYDFEKFENSEVHEKDTGFEADFCITDFEAYFGVDQTPPGTSYLKSRGGSNQQTRKKLVKKIEKSKSDCIEEYQKNIVNPEKLNDVKPYITIVPKSKLENFLKEIKEDEISKDAVEPTISYVWVLHLKMPNNFKHTAAIFVNDSGQGLLHSLVRHWDQFGQFDESIVREIFKIPKLKELLTNCKNATYPDKKEYYQARRNFKNYFEQADSNVKLALFNAQRRLFLIIKDMITKPNFKGVEASAVLPKGEIVRIRAYFEVINSNNNETLYLVLCLSKQNFPPIEEFRRQKVPFRSVRTITTLFFNQKCPTNLKEIW